MIAFRVTVLTLAAGLILAGVAHADDRGCKSSSSSNSTASQIGGSLAGFLGGMASNALAKHGVSNTYGAMDSLQNSLSSAIACALTPQERKQADHAQTQALQSGAVGEASKVNWTSNESSVVNGGTEIESRATDTSGRNCAVTHTFITDVDGQEKSVDRQMCQGADGSWAAVQ